MAHTGSPPSLRYARATTVVGLVLVALSGAAYWFAKGAIREVSTDPSSDSGAMQGVAFMVAGIALLCPFSAVAFPSLAYYLNTRRKYSSEAFLRSNLACFAFACAAVAIVMSVVVSSFVVVLLAAGGFVLGAVPLTALAGLWFRLAE